MTGRMITHTVAAVIGGYGVTWYVVEILAKALKLWAGLASSEAVLAASMTGFVFYTALVIAAFAVRKTLYLCAAMALALLACYLFNLSPMFAVA